MILIMQSVCLMKEFEEGATFTYSGAELKPTVKVYINKVLQDDEQLIENTDYIVSYSDNINAGTATVTITGIGAYSGTKKVTFTIEPKKISSPTFDGLKPEYTYTGQKVEPEFALYAVMVLFSPAASVPRQTRRRRPMNTSTSPPSVPVTVILVR